MSNPISADCSSGLHDYCTPCNCECHKACRAVEPLTGAICELLRGHDQNHLGRFPQGISQWPYDNKLQHELKDLLKLMPDSQTQELIDFIVDLRVIRRMRDAKRT